MGEDKPPTFTESLETALVEISESPSLKAGLSLIGSMVGLPGLDVWVAGRGEVIARRRLEEFLTRLLEEIEALKGQGFTEELLERYFDSEEWHDLFREALVEALRTRSRDRREYCVRILKGAITDADQKRYSPEEYLDIIANLSDLDLQVAGSLYSLQKNKNYKELDTGKRREIWEPIRDRISRERGVDKNDLSLIMERLASTGLVERIYVLVPGSPIPTYWVSSAFDKLMEFLGLPDSP